MPVPIVRTLDLRARLAAGGDGSLTAYDLDGELSRSPEVDVERYALALTGAPVDAIPAGKYLFAQMRGAPTDRLVAEEALELQKEGLWRGLELSPRLYLRVLDEEGGAVRQLLRGITGERRR